jgi:EAL domain-containing protein (putative c-di-GMP-specific phosphodiesterase class I)
MNAVATAPVDRALPADAGGLLSRLRREGGVFVADHAGLRLASHFQPIYSLSHGRVVGHEALLRASDAQGRPVPPPQVFDLGDDLDELWRRDWLARAVHLANHAIAPPADQWLFLNAHPALFGSWREGEVRSFADTVLRRLGIPPQRVVIEVLESALATQPQQVEASIQNARDHGCLIALDDFGAGHSNFDRVWRLKPEIVKLDRGLVARAAGDRAVRRMMVQLVSLLHECGALVLMEGIETAEEAFVALESDADLVQGYLFGRPQAALAAAERAPPALEAVWRDFEGRWRDEQQAGADRLQPYREALQAAALHMMAGVPLATACAPFLGLPGAELCYMLGADGRQIGNNCWAERIERATLGRPASLAFAPLRDARGARWSRRPYFRRAVQQPAQVQTTRPYRTLHGGHLSVTVSIAFAPAATAPLQVLCGDVAWDTL